MYIVDEGVNTIQSRINELYCSDEDFCLRPQCNNLNDVMFWYYVYYAYYAMNRCENFYFEVPYKFEGITALHRVKSFGSIKNRIIVNNLGKQSCDNKYEYLLDRVVKIDLSRIDLGLYDIDKNSEKIGYDANDLSKIDRSQLIIEVQACGLIPKNVEYVSAESIADGLKQPSSLSVNTITTVNTTYNKSNISEVIDNIKMCKYVFGGCNDILLLSSVLLGIDNCVYMDRGNNWVNNVYPFFSNKIDMVDKYHKGDISNTLEYLYTKDFS